MKIRTGFVANSSSSSFILAVKKGHSIKEITEGCHPLVAQFAEPVISFLEGQKLSGDVRKALSKFFRREYDDGRADREEWSFWQDLLDSLLEGEDLGEWTFCFGDASSEGGSYYGVDGEKIICYGKFEHDEGPVRLWTQGGF